MSEDRIEHRHNVIAGIVSLALVGVVIVVVLSLTVYSNVRAGPKPFVMYVSNSGSIGPGDPVYMNGRRIGRIQEATLERREGKVQTRVDFIIFEQFRDLEFPRNSVASVSGPGFNSGPRLIISFGNAGEDVDEDGEFTNTRPAGSEDIFTVLGDNLKTADKTIDSIIELLDDEDMLNDIQEMLVMFRNNVDEMASNFEQVKPDLLAAMEQLDGAKEGIDEMRETFAADSDRMTEGLQELSKALADGDVQLVEFTGQVDSTIESIRAYEETTAEAAEMSRDPAMREMFLQARWAAAEMAAMVDRSVGDPSVLGDAPGIRRAAEKFNGGDTTLEPFGGDTDLKKTE